MRNRIFIGLFYTIGLAILSLGISLIIVADLGAGPWDAFYVALSDTIGLTVGSWIFIVGAALILINGWLMKQKPDVLAVVTIVIIGGLIDFWLLVAFTKWDPGAAAVQTLVLLTGITLIGIGVSCYLQSNFGRNPIDNLMVAVHKRTGKSLSMSKTMIEVSVLIIVFFINGPIGIGTVIIAFGIGPLIQVFHKPITRFRTQKLGIPVS
ncbi:YitT family protein [Alteribacillus sp. HJP-4]|uniref:YczE/YyaS/YitT family protein n=1 Tax=Alteribacillus sp. HJP-4 TaxID=2775394 RepID=UPI0035CD302C